MEEEEEEEEEDDWDSPTVISSDLSYKKTNVTFCRSDFYTILLRGGGGGRGGGSGGERDRGSGG